MPIFKSDLATGCKKAKRVVDLRLPAGPGTNVINDRAGERDAPRESGFVETPCWRKGDSNPRSP